MSVNGGSVTNVFVAENISFELKFNLLDCFATVIGNVNVDVDTRSADPDLPVQTSRDSDDLDRSIARL